jgi:hypothetical protein
MLLPAVGVFGVGVFIIDLSSIAFLLVLVIAVARLLL